MPFFEIVSGCIAKKIRLNQKAMQEFEVAANDVCDEGVRLSSACHALNLVRGIEEEAQVVETSIGLGGQYAHEQSAERCRNQA